MAVRAKFRLNEIRQNAYNPTVRTFVFHPVSADGTPENDRFNKYSPSGEFTIMVDNPAVIEQWKLGDYYYADFTATTQEGT